jgi:hypothetical protein
VFTRQGAFNAEMSSILFTPNPAESKIDNTQTDRFLKHRKEYIMPISRKKIIMALIVAATVILALVTQIVASTSHREAFKLEGAWVEKVTILNGAPYTGPAQWSFVLSPDASGRRASMFGSIDVGFTPGPRVPFIGEMVQTGHHTAAFDSYFYGVKADFSQVITIGRVWGEATLVAEGKIEFTNHFEIYFASADADHDGIPDQGISPNITFEATSLATRIPQPVR